MPLVVGTYYWGPDTPLRLTLLLVCGVLYVAAVAIAGVAAVRALRDADAGGRGCGGHDAAADARRHVCGALSVHAQHPGRSLASRYLLPAYIPLFLFLGAAVARLGADRAWWQAPRCHSSWHSTSGPTSSSSGRSIRRGRGRGGPANRDPGGARAPTSLLRSGRRSRRQQHDQLHVAVPPRPAAVSDFLADNYYPSSVRADAARRVAILATPGDGDMAVQLSALGATATATEFGQSALLRRHPDCRTAAYRFVPRRAGGPSASPTPPAVADGDLGTAWPPRRLDRSEAGELVLDLGDSARSRGSSLADRGDRSDRAARGLGSLDAVTWEPLGVAPAEVGRPAFVADGRPVFRPRNGWLELTIGRPAGRAICASARPSRRSIGVGMVGELLAYEAVEGPLGARTPDVDAILRAVRSRPRREEAPGESRRVCARGARVTRDASTLCRPTAF